MKSDRYGNFSTKSNAHLTSLFCRSYLHKDSRFFSMFRRNMWSLQTQPAWDANPLSTLSQNMSNCPNVFPTSCRCNWSCNRRLSAFAWPMLSTLAPINSCGKKNSQSGSGPLQFCVPHFVRSFWQSRSPRPSKQHRHLFQTRLPLCFQGFKPTISLRDIIRSSG